MGWSKKQKNVRERNKKAAEKRWVENERNNNLTTISVDDTDGPDGDQLVFVEP